MNASMFALALTSRGRRGIRFVQCLVVSAIMLTLLATVAIPTQAMDSDDGGTYCERNSEGRITCYETIEVTAPQESINAPTVPSGSGGGEVVNDGTYDAGVGGGRAPRVNTHIQLNVFKRQLDGMNEAQLIEEDKKTRNEALAEYERTGQWGPATQRNQAVIDELKSRGCSYTLNGAVDRVWSCPNA